MTTIQESGLFALTAEGAFVSLPKITTSAYDARGRLKAPGPGHADAYSIFDPVPLNPFTDIAFGNHPSTHTHVFLCPNGLGMAYVVSQDFDATPTSPSFPEFYFRRATNKVDRKLNMFMDTFFGGKRPSIEDDPSRRLSKSSNLSPHRFHGILFFKVSPNLAFNEKMNFSPKEIDEWQKKYEAL